MAEASPLSPAATRRYVVALGVLGMPVLAAAAYALALDLAAGRAGWAQLAVASVLAVGAGIVLRTLLLFDWRGQRVALAPDEVLVFIALASLPLSLVILFAVPAMTAYQAQTRRGLARGAFNVSVLAIATSAGALAHQAAAGLGAPPALAALIGIVAYTPVNLLMVAGVFATREDAPVLTVYRERFVFPTLLHLGLGASLGVSIVALWSYHPLAVLALAPILAFARAHVQLVARTDREAVVHRRLAEVSQGLVGEPDEEVVARRALETCAEIFPAGRVTLTVARRDGSSRTWRRDAATGFDPGRGALAEALPGRGGAPLGAIVLHPTRDTTEGFSAADRVLLRVVAAETAVSMAHARALRDLDASRKELLSTRVARPLVKRIVRSLVEETRADHRVLARLGQALAREAESGDLDTLCRAYGEMGLGALAFVDARAGKHVFRGRDLFERTPGAHATTCHLALGFLTGAVSRLHGGAPTVGAETACESRGARECAFVVQVRPERPQRALSSR